MSKNYELVVLLPTIEYTYLESVEKWVEGKLKRTFYSYFFIISVHDPLRKVIKNIERNWRKGEKVKKTIRFNLGLLNSLKENPKNQKSVSRLTNFTTRYTTWSWHMGTINYPSRDPCFVIEPTSCSHFFSKWELHMKFPTLLGLKINSNFSHHQHLLFCKIGCKVDTYTDGSSRVPELVCIIFHPNFLPYLIIYQKAREKH